MRIVVLTNESLPVNVIIEAMMRELPGRVVGIVMSTVSERGVSAPRALWRHARRMGPRFFAIVFSHRLGVRALWWLRRMRRLSNLPPALREIAKRAAIPLMRTRDINSPGTLAALRATSPDLLVSIYFNQRIGRDALAIPRGGAINLHPAMLPRNRGPSPSFWVVAEGETRSGVTMHWIDEGLDTGDILLQREVEVPAGASVSVLMGTVVAAGAAALVEAVRLIEAGQAPRQAQDPRMASYQSWPRGSDLRSLWRRGARYGTAYELVAACEGKAN